MGERGPEFEPTRLPEQRDIVRIDGRWAQVLSMSEQDSAIRYLDDGSDSRVIWAEYLLTRHIGSHVQRVNETEHSITAQEVMRIRWGSEQDEHPHLPQEVTVFGEFERKPTAESAE